MPRSARSIEGDTPDLIAWREWGDRSGATEALLAANPGLAAKGPVLPTGTAITIPDLPDPEAPVTKLWE